MDIKEFEEKLEAISKRLYDRQMELTKEITEAMSECIELGKEFNKSSYGE